MGSSIGGTSGGIGTLGGTVERPAVFFASPEEFRRWLQANHDSAGELWMGLFKKHVSDRGLTWEQAVPEALCFGWIDSVSQRIDDDSRRQRWTPRRPNSNWSAVNIALVAELTAAGKMHPAGIAAFERRTAERSGIYSYEQDGEPVFPPEFQSQLDADPVATAWFDGAPASYRKIVVRWVLTAKREATRQSRMAQFLDDSRLGRLIPSQRYGDEPAWARRLRGELNLG